MIAELAVADSGRTRFGLMSVGNAFGQDLKEETLRNLEAPCVEAVSVIDCRPGRTD